jgi:hypothetical protein
MKIMSWFKRKSEKDKLYEAYQKKLEESMRMSTKNRSESDRLMMEANALLEKWEALKS